MKSLYNKTAMKVAVLYAVAIVGLLVWGDHGADGEGQIWNHLFLGFPWVLVTDDRPLGITSFVILNAVTLYISSLICIESFRFDNPVTPRKPNATRRP